MAFPLMVRPIRLSIEAIDREVTESALTLGAPALVRLLRVTVPLAAPGLAAGALLGFAKALGEFGATITFVGAIPGETLTLPSAIYAATQSPGEETHALALCGVACDVAGGRGRLLAADRLAAGAARFGGWRDAIGLAAPPGDVGQGGGDLGHVIGLADHRRAELFGQQPVVAIAGGEHERHPARGQRLGHRPHRTRRSDWRRAPPRRSPSPTIPIASRGSPFQS